MEERLNIAQLGALMNQLHRITGLKFALLDASGKEVYTTGYRTEFCALIGSTPEGRARCEACDRNCVQRLVSNGNETHYRCHAGLMEWNIPVTEHGRMVGVILLGQALDGSDFESQWRATCALCGWYPDLRGLRRAFERLPRISEEHAIACTEIARACVSEVRLSGLLREDISSDFQRLEAYIDRHYGQRLTLDDISYALNIGKTRLCALTAREAGTTPTRMIALRRVAAARDMLAHTGESVQRIAEAVGIPDYNYFSKVFRRLEGMTPTQYRKRSRAQWQPAAKESGMTDQVENQQQHHRAADCDQQAVQIEARYTAQSDETGDPSTDARADDANQNVCTQAHTGILSYDHAGNPTCQRAQNQP